MCCACVCVRVHVCVCYVCVCVSVCVVCCARVHQLLVPKLPRKEKCVVHANKKTHTNIPGLTVLIVINTQCHQLIRKYVYYLGPKPRCCVLSGSVLCVVCCLREVRGRAGSLGRRAYTHHTPKPV